MIDSLLKLHDVLLTSQFSYNGETNGLNIQNGFIDSLDIMFRNFHPGQSSVASIFCGELGFFETSVKFQIFFVWILWCAFNHH